MISRRIVHIFTRRRMSTQSTNIPLSAAVHGATCGSASSVPSEAVFPKLEILLESDEYIVVNKPADLRMDGDSFPDSLEKRLIAQLGGGKENYKWVHQLDLATSGVLCIAKTRKSASVASEAFQRRETYKEYFALVDGHLNASEHWLSVLSVDILGLREKYNVLHDDMCKKVKAGDEIENSGRWDKEKGVGIKKNRSGGDGWEVKVMEENLDRCITLLQIIAAKECNQENNAKGNKFGERQSGVASNDGVEFRKGNRANVDLESVILGLSRLSKEEFLKDNKSRKSLRKELKRAVDALNLYYGETKYVFPELIVSEKPVEEGAVVANIGCIIDPSRPLCLTPSYTFIARVKPDEINNERSEESVSGPDDKKPRIESCPETKGEIFVDKVGSRSDSLMRLVVMCPLTEIPGDFRCEYGSERDPGRYSETIIDVLRYGAIKGKPVTLLRLIPRTGRRHQLRLHCLLLGHPIFGDTTYVPYGPNGSNLVSMDQPEEGERMMLHARRLIVPNLDGGLLFDVETSDPFTQYLD